MPCQRRKKKLHNRTNLIISLLYKKKLKLIYIYLFNLNKYAFTLSIIIRNI